MSVLDSLTLPAGASAGTDWSQTLQNIAAYGASRIFDSKAVSKIYAAANQTPMLMDIDGTLYPAGTPAPSSMSSGVSGAPLGIPLLFWLIGGGLLAFVVLKD